MAGSFIVPQMPPQLLEALRRQQASPQGPGMGAMPVNGRAPTGMPPVPTPMGPLPSSAPPVAAAPPIQMGAGGVNLNPAPPMTDASGMVKIPMPAGGPRLPPVTDDPAVNKMGEMPKTPDLNSYLNPALQRYNSDVTGFQQADEANRIDPQKLKPRLWERLLGFAAGATQLRDPSNAANVTSSIVNRRRNEAEANRNLALEPWKQRMEVDKEGVPLAESSARIAGEQGRLNLDASKENRERYSALSNSDYKEAIAQVRDEVAKGNIDKAANLLDQKQQELNEKKSHDAEWFQMQHAILDLKQQLVEKGKDHTSQTVGAETQKANALRTAEATFNKAYQAEGFPSDPKTPWTDEQRAKLAQLIQQREQAKQDAEDAYLAKASELKGAPVEHQDVESWRGGKAQPAQPAESKTTAPAAAKEEALPNKVGPANEEPAIDPKTGKKQVGTGADGKKYAFYRSTGEWMLVPDKSSGGK